jgi:hypothetical protein
VRAADGGRSWVKHDIDKTVSQYHDLWLADIDQDGEVELITGKRYRAHNDGDPGAADPIGLFYFKINPGAAVTRAGSLSPGWTALP